MYILKRGLQNENYLVISTPLNLTHPLISPTHPSSYLSWLEGTCGNSIGFWFLNLVSKIRRGRRSLKKQKGLKVSICISRILSHGRVVKVFDLKTYEY